ncbi:MAG: amylosucrase [Butyrivibrio sp.]|nr:amylosucrase [Butyrivibrio sp.]
MNKTSNRHSSFDKRLAEHMNELKWLYMELYHGDTQAFSYFCRMLREYDAARPAALKALDRKRMAQPDWFRSREMLGMLMYVDSFAGTLRGVTAHLDYLKETGVNYLHLMPIMKSPEGRSDGGYAVSDFRAVEPRFGDIKDLTALTNRCHKEGISVCLDFVMNHTSEDHEWAVRARQGDRACQERYFFYDNWEIPFKYEETVPQVFPQTAPGNFTWCAEAGKVVMTTFYPYQWDLNYHNPVVFNDMTANMLYMCNCGVDIIRLDAVPYIWKELGTTCRNLPQVHTLVRMMRIAAQIVAPGALLLGEVVMEPKEVVPYFGTTQKPECHMLYNVTTMASTWHTVATRDVRLLASQLDKVFSLPREYVFLNYLRCHDDIGWGLDYPFLARFGMKEVEHKRFLNDYFRGRVYGSEARGELYNDDPRLGDARLCGTTASLCGIEAAEYERDSYKLDRGIALDLMLHAFLFTLSGPPVLYSGDEIGQCNDYGYHEDPLRFDDSRYLHRGRLDWSSVERRNEPGTREERIFSGLRRLRGIRVKERAFSSRADVWIVQTGNDHVLGIGRYCDGQKLIALFNFDGETQTARLSLEETGYRDLLTGHPCASDTAMLAPYGFAWMSYSFTR